MLGFLTIQFKKRVALLVGFLVFCVVFSVTFSGEALGEERTLERFEIETSDNNSVKVILYTDGRATYHTEAEDKGFSLILDKTRLSEASLRNGLPVVIDNKNRFIGRAVAGAEGQIKIIIPNLPTNQYSVSVLQRSVPRSLVKSSKVPERAKAPKVAVKKTSAQSANPIFENQFEEMVSQLEKPAHLKASSRWKTGRKPEIISPGSGSRIIQMSPAVVYKAPGLPPQAPQVSVPYYPTYPTASPTPVSQRAVSPQYYFPQWKPQQSVLRTTRPSGRQKHWVQAVPVESYNTLAVESSDEAKSLENREADAVESFRLLSFPSAFLAYRQLDPGFVELQETLEAGELLDAGSANSSEVSFMDGALKHFSSWSTRDISGFPLWGVVLAVFFLGGIGLFALMGALLLARLFLNPKLLVQPAPVFTPSASSAAFSTSVPEIVADPFYVDKMAEIEEESPLIPLEIEDEEGPNAFESEPEVIVTEQLDEPVVFQDKAVVNASDYLLRSSGSVKEAIRKTTVLKFSSRKKRVQV